MPPKIDKPATIPIRPIQPTPPPDITSNNEASLARYTRRLREIVRDVQQRRGTGKIWVYMNVEDGCIRGDADVRSEWKERLT